jgi:hypothetical protein
MILVYIAFMLATTTVWFAAGARTSAYKFVDAAFYPRNTNADCTPAAIVENLAGVLQIWGSDGALVGDQKTIIP